VWKDSWNVENGLITIRYMVTHRFPSKEQKKLLTLFADYRDGVMKAMIDF